MNTRNSSDCPSAADSDALLWKNKYLNNLEEQEKEQSQQSETLNMLRRGLLSVSLAGDGLDPELDRKLAALRKRLHKLEQGIILDDLLKEIEIDLLRLDSANNQEAVALKFALSNSISQLLDSRAVSGSASEGTLKALQKQVRKSAEDRATQFGLLKELVEILIALVNGQSSSAEKSGGGFWKTLFGIPGSIAGEPKATDNAAKTAAPASDISDSGESSQAKPILDQV